MFVLFSRGFKFFRIDNCFHCALISGGNHITVVGNLFHSQVKTDVDRQTAVNQAVPELQMQKIVELQILTNYFTSVFQIF